MALNYIPSILEALFVAKSTALNITFHFFEIWVASTVKERMRR
jgi:hypothetical protein